MDSERCSIFIADPKKRTIWLRFGTGIEGEHMEAPTSGSVVGEAISTGQTIIRSGLDQQSGFHTIADSQTGFTTRNLICMPIISLVESMVIGAVQILNKQSGTTFTPEDAERLDRVVRYLALALESSQLHRQVTRISSQLDRDLKILGDQKLKRGRFIANSALMRRLLDRVRQVAEVPVNIYISGESGTGKEVIAQMIHALSDRHAGPFVAVNCSSIPEHLMEAEFFGHEKGAFTGAVHSRSGRFEEASGGTLFLDEIADMPATIQPKFLRAIQEREGERLGSHQKHTYDFRIISATSRDLRQLVAEGKFREDLFFRLYAVELAIPPLRNRREDIIPLAMMFLNEVRERFKRHVTGFAPEVLTRFETFPWPGNVRQLHHEVERLVALTREGEELMLNNCSPEVRKHIPEEPTANHVPTALVPVPAEPTLPPPRIRRTMVQRPFPSVPPPLRTMVGYRPQMHQGNPRDFCWPNIGNRWRWLLYIVFCAIPMATRRKPLDC
jgi:transcriptional regulator with GAF, ATPase, and Fis domain